MLLWLYLCHRQLPNGILNIDKFNKLLFSYLIEYKIDKFDYNIINQIEIIQ